MPPKPPKPGGSLGSRYHLMVMEALSLTDPAHKADRLMHLTHAMHCVRRNRLYRIVKYGAAGAGAGVCAMFGGMALMAGAVLSGAATAASLPYFIYASAAVQMGGLSVVAASAIGSMTAMAHTYMKWKHLIDICKLKAGNILRAHPEKVLDAPYAQERISRVIQQEYRRRPDIYVNNYRECSLLARAARDSVRMRLSCEFNNFREIPPPRPGPEPMAYFASRVLARQGALHRPKTG